MPESFAPGAGGALDDDLLAITERTAVQARTFLNTIGDISSGAAPQAALPLLLLALADLTASGAVLGAIVDVVPAERFEPDAGPDADVDPLRTALAQVLAGIDEYTDVADPVLTSETGVATLSDDLASIAQELTLGLAHHAAGNLSEALWWWQFSYLQIWGERAASALRVVLVLLGHLRLDVPDDVAGEAEFDALHRD
ncbi:DUF5063 domain-containing protein [Litorihabitans aurantiacus]|uniref:DUF5063 domain-containing protein n=1 Tax=Litorihabitans aurantiacus TaxID=1930061 RepID=A0AA38CQY1_9MICO|nr:DUF5063 domain-containing protein [Litorihabitans aurantiacus]GMA32618.1 DUF5063 domain-containing protein [Litorihabitans aurantiacus]